MELNIPRTNKKRVVIIGGGFGGIKLVNKLDSDLFQIVLVDRHNYHQFPPLLYQVASSGLEATSISFPFRKLFQKKKDFYFRLTEVKAIRMEQNKIETMIGDLSYDYLVIAAGTTTSYFGNKVVEKNTLAMKNVPEALALRNTLLNNFEKATICTDPQEKRALLNMVVVGAGPSGVEISGALAEMRKYILHKDYPEIKASDMHIYLIEGGPKVLASMSAEASEDGEKELKKMGVEVWLNKKVSNYESDTVSIEGGETIPAKTVIWVSGVTAVHFDGIDEKYINKGGRINVNAYNQVSDFLNVFAIGDIAVMVDKEHPKGHPQLAQPAIQQGALLAKNLKRIEKGEQPEAFRYKDLGSLATIGRNKAVADLNKLKFHGFFAWVIWLVVHLRSILGVKNRLFVLMDWMWSYLTYDQSIRLILSAPRPDDEINKEDQLEPQG